MTPTADRMTFPTLEGRRMLSATGGPASPLLWALVASTIVHTAVVAMPPALPGMAPTTRAEQGTTLEATLLPASAAQADVEPTSVVTASPIAIANQDATTSLQSPASTPQPPAPARALLGVGSPNLQIAGKALADNNRLGDLLSKRMAEAPVEVDFPARPKEPIRVRYPEAALAAGREGSVAVWVLVSPEGTPDEVTVVDGPPEFADAVVAAINEAHFIPAQNNLVPMRYALAFQFDFALGASAPGAITAKR
jgi:TonB family protein